MWEQYDHVILGNTVQRPGGDAAVVRVHDGPKALALTVDVTPRYCEADPFEGGKQAVAEAWRNITAVGGKPLARHRQSQLRQSREAGDHGPIRRLRARHRRGLQGARLPGRVRQCLALQRDQGRAILPTPTIGGVGVLSDFTKSATLAFKAAGETILLIGETHGWLGQSLYLRDICGREEGAPPPVDLVEERENGDFVRALIGEGLVTAAHDVSDGGLLVAVAEMAMASGIGAALDAVPEDPPRMPSGSARIRPAMSSRCRPIGRCGDPPGAGRQCSGPPDRHHRRANASLFPVSAQFSIKALSERFEGWLPDYMAGGVSLTGFRRRGGRTTCR